jgi:hypothetical protein
LPAKFQINMLHCLGNIKKTNSTNGHCSHTCNMPLQTRTEGKVQTFPWLLLQNRKWTAERLRARGLPHDDCCSLCDQEFETAKHLVLQCPFAREVWMQFQNTSSFAVRIAALSSTVCGWWNWIRRGKINEPRGRKISLYQFTLCGAFGKKAEGEFSKTSTWMPLH